MLSHLQVGCKVTSTYPYGKRPKKSVSKGNLARANLAIEDALKRIKTCKNEFIKLNVSYLASLLFQQAQNDEGVQRCNRLLDDSIQDCESSANPDEELFRAATSILYLKADSILDVPIMDVNAVTISPEITVHVRTKTIIDKHSESDFQKSETLRLRAVALADKLDESSHLRRKAHRDMSLWYSHLGKTEKAEQQKQELYELLGFEDESILYPQDGGCGHVVWWRREKVGAMGCGMGWQKKDFSAENLFLGRLLSYDVRPCDA